MKLEASHTLLAVDTANGQSSLVLRHAGETVHLAQTEGRDNLAWLRSQTQLALHAAGLKIGDLQALAVNTGPGAMTGLRVGVGYVQALAIGIERPVVAVDTLANLALAAVEAGFGPEGAIHVALDARLGELYAASYQLTAGEVQTLRPPALLKPVAARGGGDEAGHYAGPGWEEHADQLPEPARLWPGCQPHARFVAQLAIGQPAQPAHEVHVDYLRQKVARVPQRVREQTAGASQR